MIELNNITVGPPGCPRLSGANLTVQEGESIVLCGPSGAGKTTLGRAIAGLIPIETGSITIAGQLAGTPAGNLILPSQRAIGMLFQDFGLWPHLSVGENVALAADHSWWSWRGAAKEVREALAACKLDGFERRRISSLSGGELQRVALARAIVGKPKILLLDEPFTALDMPVRDTLAELIRHLVATLRITAVTVLHDPHDALGMKPDRIVVMEQGKIVDDLAPAQLAKHHSVNGFLASWRKRLQSGLELGSSD